MYLLGSLVLSTGYFTKMNTSQICLASLMIGQGVLTYLHFFG